MSLIVSFLSMITGGCASCQLSAAGRQVLFLFSDAPLVWEHEHSPRRSPSASQQLAERLCDAGPLAHTPSPQDGARLSYKDVLERTFRETNEKSCRSSDNPSWVGGVRVASKDQEFFPTHASQSKPTSSSSRHVEYDYSPPPPLCTN